MKLINRQTGVGLIEALIAALVFAVGIAALVKLQGTFFKNSSDANARSVAMSIAQEKMEDLRGFQTADSNDNDIFDFTSIGTNAGGRCTESSDDDVCTPALASTGTNQSIPIGNFGFSRNWTVTDYYYNSAILTTPVPSGTIPDQKKVTVTVSWTDADGSGQTVALDGLINQNSGLAIGSVANFDGAGGSGESPVVPYTPSTDVHVVPVGVGTDTKRETLVPSSKTVDGYTRTKFIAYTYAAGNPDELVREEEFQNVACSCRFNGTSDADNKTYAAAHPQWDTAKDTYIDVDGDLVSGKVKGCVQGGGSNCAASPEQFCEVCCRDHHDISSVARKFDPFRSNDDFTNTGDHKHYNGTTAVTSGSYLESCRFKRVDGFWRVYQDWNLIHLTVLPLSDLTDTTLVDGETKKDIYTDYVKDIVDTHIVEEKVGGEALSSPPAKPLTLDHTVSSNYIAMAALDKRDLTARGVYLDFIDDGHLDKVQEKKDADEDYLLHLPFYELEVAPESGWLSSADDKVRVGPFDSTGTDHDLTGGQLEALASDSNAIVIEGKIKKSNSGIVALSQAIDYNASTNPDSATKSDIVDICVGCSAAAGCLRPWGGTVNNGDSITAWQSETVPYGESCESETRTCTNGTLSGSFLFDSCSIEAGADCQTPWGDTISHGNDVTAYQFATVNTDVNSATCVDETRSCDNGVLSGGFQYETCTEIHSDTFCAIPWGGTTPNGSDITAYQTSIVPYGSTCVSQSRHCASGALSGSYTYQTCTVEPGADCTAPWGATVASGSSVTAYQFSSVISPDTCTAENRTCTNGTLNGSYTFESCTVTISTCATSVTGTANNKDDTITLSAAGSPTACSVNANKGFTCPQVITAIDATITVTSAGTVNSTKTILPICGTKTVNFP
ncbi:MAG: type IV pilus modification PilV family protein [Gammaproteobacteria bacterium]